MFESLSSLFYQIFKFASQIISEFEMRKMCRRIKGNLLPPLEESPQVFGIARKSEVGTNPNFKTKKNSVMGGTS